MKLCYALCVLLLPSLGLAQAVVSGRVLDQTGKPVAAANIFIEGSYDGGVSDASGNFTFETHETGTRTLLVSSFGFQTSRTTIEIGARTFVGITLIRAENSLDEVVVSAGTFEAGDNSKASVLKPLDIVTTAGSAGNIIAALQTLPGTQTVGEDGRLFVRGGEADETQTFIDGIRASQPYGATAPELPTRGRFSPFLFSGISFSTGGYSAEYGQALSSVLLLHTKDEEEQNKTDLSVMTVGLGAGHTIKGEKNSLTANLAYVDLTPYQVLVPQNIKWNRPYQSFAGEAVYRSHFDNGLLKVYASFDAAKLDLDQKSINEPSFTRTRVRNDNFYMNANYKGYLPANWQIFAGFGYGISTNDVDLNAGNMQSLQHSTHLKLRLRKKFPGAVKLNFGVEHFITSFDEGFRPEPETRYGLGYRSDISAAFSEVDFRLSRNMAIKAGLRYSHTELLDEDALLPRLSFAWRVSPASQFSLAYGIFDQAPGQQFLKFSDFTDMSSERASHYILNYQFIKDRKTFRAEAYYKKYDNLIRFGSEGDYDSYANSGDGFARGLDLFWRDGSGIKYLEYWVSYSFIDTERLYRDFPSWATPPFVADHSMSLVTKYWINNLRSQVGFTYSFSSGRPYDNPNEIRFMSGTTRAYHNFSFNWAYLLDQQKILYFSVSNVFNNAHVFGYEYADHPGLDGRRARRAIMPAADRFFFIGFFWTISDDKQSNQLKNL